MRKNFAAFSVVCAGALFSLGISPVQAESPSAGTDPMPPTDFAATTTPKGLEDCFNYYTFGSVTASLSASLSRAYQGTGLTVSGTITNQNPYPVSNATVWVKVIKLNTDVKKGSEDRLIDVTDMFKVAEHITLAAGDTKPISFVWKVPADAQPGRYRLATFVQGNGQFSLSGLLFTDDVFGGTLDVSVTGRDFGALRFDRGSVQLDKKPFHFTGYPPQTDASSTPTVSATVVNSTGSILPAHVAWKLYYWDNALPSHLLAERTEEQLVAAHASTTLSYTVTDTAHSVYYLTGELLDKNGAGRSIIGVRFVRNGVNLPRLEFAGVNRYPVATSSTAFACMHATSDDQHTPVADGKLTISVFAPGLFGTTTIAQKSYEGPIPADMLALTVPFRTKASTFTVIADLFQNGKIVDSVAVPYRCEELQDACPSAPSAGLLVLWVIAGLAVTGGSIFGAYLLVRKYRLARKNNPTYYL